MSKKHMECLVDLDWCTYICPCGAEFCTRFDYDGSGSKKFREEHKDHTSGKVHEETTDRGATVYVHKPPPEIRDL